jgi:hypothetical protein
MDSLILALEKQFFRTAGAKEDAIKALGLTPMRYYQLAARLIWTEDAIRHDPITVKRLRRIAQARQDGRGAAS